MSNHDLPRAASRYAKGQDDSQSFLAMALLLALRGTPFMYYGEEIGMRDIRLTRSEILDPPGKKYWPLYKGRDGCRSPMQWNASPNAGFSTGKPWLPVNPDYTQRNVFAQQADPNSLFNFTKKLLSLRKSIPALSPWGLPVPPRPAWHPGFPAPAGESNCFCRDELHQSENLLLSPGGRLGSIIINCQRMPR